MDLWKLCDYITSVNLELHFWDLVQCLLISFCFGSEILVQFGQPQPPKNTPKPPKHFEYELMETLRLYNFCRFGARGLGFGTVFTNIILLWIRNFEKNRTTPTPKKYPKLPKHLIYELNNYTFFLLFRTGFAESLWKKGSDKQLSDKSIRQKLF